MASETSLRSLGPTVFLPSLLFGIGEGAILPVIALAARDLGGSVAMAGLVVALLGVGKIIGDIPAGILANRIGERRAMLVGIMLALAAMACMISASSVLVLSIGVAGLGLAESVWGLARHAYLTEVVPFHRRARALSTLAGTQRIGLFLGPFLGALAMTTWDTDGAFWVHAASSVAAGAVLLVLPDPARRADDPPATTDEAVGTFQVVRRYWPLLRTLGAGALLLSAVRASRAVALPLWAEHIDLDPATTSVVFGLAGGVEMLMFYPGGMIMDRWGRRMIVLTVTVGLGAAYLVLPLTQTVVTLTLVAAAMGVANGLGSGINMTIGADISPQVNRAAFLGTWRLCGDLGNGAGPVLFAAITSLAALAPAIIAVSVLAGLSATVMARWLPRHGASPP